MGGVMTHNQKTQRFILLVAKDSFALVSNLENRLPAIIRCHLLSTLTYTPIISAPPLNT